MFYSSEADALRAFLRDKFELKATDVGGGWLIFDLPEADMGVHPTGGKPVSGTVAISLIFDIVRKLRLPNLFSIHFRRHERGTFPTADQGHERLARIVRAQVNACVLVLEHGRIVGYPGAQFFYPMLADLLKKLAPPPVKAPLAIQRDARNTEVKVTR